MAAIAVERLHMASFKLHAEFNPHSRIDTRIDVYAYLILGLPSDTILVDTGIGADVPYIDQRFEPCRTPIDEELARVGADPSDVTMVVNSHLHFDHCGNNALFPRATVLVQDAELATARVLRTRYTVPHWFDYTGASIEPVSGNMKLLEGISLLATPGHTPGHQSVLVETDTGSTLVAAQAAFTAAEFERGGDADSQAHDGFRDAYVRSIRKLESIGADRVYFSHDTASS